MIINIKLPMTEEEGYTHKAEVNLKTGPPGLAIAP